MCILSSIWVCVCVSDPFWCTKTRCRSCKECVGLFKKQRSITKVFWESGRGFFFLPEREFQSKCTISVNIHGWRSTNTTRLLLGKVILTIVPTLQGSIPRTRSLHDLELARTSKTKIPPPNSNVQLDLHARDACKQTDWRMFFFLLLWLRSSHLNLLGDHRVAGTSNCPHFHYCLTGLSREVVWCSQKVVIRLG